MDVQLLGLILTLGAPSAAPLPVEAPGALERIQRELDRTVWDASESELAEVLQDGPLRCSDRSPEELRSWERTCVRLVPELEVRWTFQLLLLTPPVAPRLERLHLRAGELRRGDARATYEALAAELDAKLPRVEDRALHGGAKVRASRHLRWESRELSVELAWFEWRAGDFAVELAAEHHHVEALIDATIRYEQSLLPEDEGEFDLAAKLALAHVLLLDQSWSRTGQCSADGRRSFHVVIERATAFLAARPASPLRVQARLALAQAQEAWWWVSQLTGSDPNAADVSPADRRGGERARQRAIVAYRALLRERLEPGLAAYATAHLAQLLLGVEVHQRRFSCTSYC